MRDLEWDYAPVRKILVSFMQQKLLPGYIALHDKDALGYIYFLMNGSKGILGNIFVRKSEFSREISNKLLSKSISDLKDLPKIRRIEAQIMPFNDLYFADIFIEKGFCHYPRSYLALDSETYTRSISAAQIRFVSWSNSYLPMAALIILASYKNQSDADICSDYRSVSGCEKYLHSIIESPGCGTFLPEASFIVLDENSRIIAFILGSRISEGIGMIPQIVVHPRYQGQGFGNMIMDTCIHSFQKLGFRKITLTVTDKNSRAYEWYRRLGFKACKQFGAFSWNRPF